ncbi:MAG: 50S ribosomal protein L17 [candidate division WS6 bacterium 34_10]|uniref:50S ribosomal protein L17 n=1 Tax=candidate division WS6 bacterium 34_10 TaxID=1641389 RepID=A0A101HJ93_9BACT|nr:MAG: 50S ribosomal protein L17 [candidate division WS6 bacterium 34_10]
MYKRIKIKKLGRKKTHRESLIQNQLRTLFTHGIITTTTRKAKATKAAAQSLLSKIDKKEISVSDRRELKKYLGKKDLMEKAIKYAQNEDHGVRIVKVGFRSGDNAELSRVELIGFEGKRKRKVAKKEKDEKETSVKESKKGRIPNKDIEDREPKKVASGKQSKAKRKSSERVRTRAGL